jgi:hypothetical protein
LTAQGEYNIRLAEFTKSRDNDRSKPIHEAGLAELMGNPENIQPPSTASNRHSGSRRWLLRIVKWTIIVLVLWGLVHTVRGSWDELRQHTWSVDYRWLLLSAGCYLLGMLPSGLFWHRILIAMGQRPALGETLRAYYIGHLGKYVPGKAMVVVLRAGLIRGQRVDTAVAAASVFLETLTMMAVGSFLSGGILFVLFPQHWALVPLALLLLVVSGLPTLPPVFKRLVRMVVSKRFDSPKWSALDGVGFRLMAGGWLAVAVGWLLIGLSLWCVLRGLGENMSLIETLPIITASAALATVAGFLSLIPGGAGIRELILAQVMAPQFGRVIALVSAILIRLVWLLSEVAISGILYRFARPAPSDE